MSKFVQQSRLLSRAACALLLIAGCQSARSTAKTSAEPRPSAKPTALASSARPIGGERPLVTLRVPKSYRPGNPTPLLLVLHGYGSVGAGHVRYFALDSFADDHQMIVAAPDGLIDDTGKRFWNAVDACCDFEQRGVDDLAYLESVLDDLAARYTIDPARVYVVGHSNGGAMALRLACETPRVAAVVSVGAPFWSENALHRCRPTVPVAVRLIHGTADDIVPFDGGAAPQVHPRAQGTSVGARRIAAIWGAANHCSTVARSGAALDIDGLVAGAETTPTNWPGCAGGSAVELWTLKGSGHSPTFSRKFADELAGFLAAHPRK